MDEIGIVHQVDDVAESVGQRPLAILDELNLLAERLVAGTLFRLAAEPEAVLIDELDPPQQPVCPAGQALGEIASESGIVETQDGHLPHLIGVGCVERSQPTHLAGDLLLQSRQIRGVSCRRLRCVFYG